jgi:V/A-type H+-transporting ATPase subunit I
MFKPTSMSKIRVFILENYLDEVTRLLSKLCVLHVIETEKSKEEILKFKKIYESYKRDQGVLNRINHILDILKISEDSEDSKIKISLPSQKNLTELENKFGIIEDITKKKKNIAENLLKELEELENEEKILRGLSELKIKAEYLGLSKFLYIIAGLLDEKDIKEFKERIEEVTQDNYEIIKTEGKKKVLLALITLERYADEVNNIFREISFEEFPLKLKETNLKRARKRIKEIKREIQDLEDKLESIKKENCKELWLMRGLVKREVKISEFFLMLNKTKKVYIIEGYIPKKKLNEFLEKIENATEGKFYLEILKPEKHENIPVKLENPKILKPFEEITKMFGFPAYDEIDPTPLIALTFPLFFGLMFGDIGHGAVIGIFGIVLSKFFPKKGKSYRNFGKIFAYCGLSALIFGFLYGSFFGNEELLPEMWIKPTHDIKGMIGVVLFIGVMQMSLGIFINSINKLGEEGIRALIHFFGKIWFLFGEGILITKLLNFPVPLLEKFSNYGFLTIMIYGLIFPGILLLALELIHELKKKFQFKKFLISILSSLFEIFDTFILFLGNTISYSRLLILALVHAMMGSALFIIAEIAPQPLNFLVLIVGTIIILMLEGLIVFVHTVRLHFYEWFNKFYSGSGIKHEPFTIA